MRITREIRRLDDKIDNVVEKQSEKFVSIIKHNDIKERIDKLSNVENISFLNEVYIPKIVENGDKIDEFLKQIDHIKEVVLHYDEVLCVKANKS